MNIKHKGVDFSILEVTKWDVTFMVNKTIHKERKFFNLGTFYFSYKGYSVPLPN